MAEPRKQLHLCAFPHAGPLGWRMPNSCVEGDMDLGLYVKIAQDAERGLFDALFLADNIALNHWHSGLEVAHRLGNAVVFEPFTLLGALAMVTSRLGLMATASTTYNHPYHIARKFASLDHISGGRTGWNVVTSRTAEEASNFGLIEEVDSAARYARANEFVDVVRGLWDEWSDDAFVRDQASGNFYDPAKLRTLNHVGDQFRVSGPLNIPRPPQGRPVICQAGRSADGIDLAARTADLIFNNQHTPAANRAFRNTVRSRAVAHGRRADDIRFMAGLFVVVADTEEAAQRKMREARDSVDMATAKHFLGVFLPGVDLDAVGYDEPIPDTEAARKDAAMAGIVLEDHGRRVPMRELCTSYGNHWRQLEVIGAPGQVADLMEDWLGQEAADGFNLLTLDLKTGFADFADGVVPELQRRGIYRKAYEGTTLRDHLGIARPSNP